MEVILSDKGLFALIVLIPIIMGGVSAYVGWNTLTERLHNQKWTEINLLLDKSKKNRTAYHDFGEKYEVFKSEETVLESEMINQRIINLRDQWSDFLREPKYRQIRWIDLESGKSKKWSMEQLYYVILPSNGQRYSGLDKISVLNEIAIRKDECFVGYLYELASTSKSILIATYAARAISIITNNDPYKPDPMFYVSAEHFLENDIPEFKQLTKWWKDRGERELRYRCPFDEVLANSRDKYIDGIDTVQLDNLKEILNTFPRLARTRAIIAYLDLNEVSSFSKVKNNAVLALEDSSTEPLPFLLLAYMAKVEGDDEKFKYWVNLLIGNVNPSDIMACLLNEKFRKNNFINVFPYELLENSSVY